MTAEQRIVELESKVAELKAENEALKKTICEAWDYADVMSDAYDILQPVVYEYRGLT